MPVGPSYDFSGLTTAQQWLIVLGGWRIGDRWPDGRVRPQPTPRVVEKLIDRDLVIPFVVFDGDLQITEYHVPIAVHMAYCESCEPYVSVKAAH